MQKIDVVRDQSWIDTHLSTVVKQVDSKIDTNEGKREIGHQVLTVKVAGSLGLLDRFMANTTDDLRYTTAQSTISVLVIDDSARIFAPQEYHNALNKNGVEGAEVVRVKNQSSETLVGRIRNRGLKEIDRNDQKRSFLLSLQALLTENGGNKNWDTAIDSYDNGIIAQAYCTLGGGHASTANVAALYAAYELGRRNVSLDKGLFTHNDDDILYYTLASDEEGTPYFLENDYFREREILFSDPETLFSAGKYVGVSGSPLGQLRRALSIVNGIILNRADHISPMADSPYRFYDILEHKFKKFTAKESFEKLPEIIQSFIQRSPMAGLKIETSYNLWLNARTLRFDQGNYTMTGELGSKLPFPNGSVPEFLVSGILRAIYRGKDPERIFKIEQPIVHLRESGVNRSSAFKGKIDGGLVSRHTLDQIAVEHLLKEDREVIEALQRGLDDKEITTGMLSETMPAFYDVRLNSLEAVDRMTSVLELLRDELTGDLGKTHPIIVHISDLLYYSCHTHTDEIRKQWSETLSPERLSVVKKGMLRFIKQARWWNKIYQYAYEASQEK